MTPEQLLAATDTVLQSGPFLVSDRMTAFAQTDGTEWATIIDGTSYVDLNADLMISRMNFDLGEGISTETQEVAYAHGQFHLRDANGELIGLDIASIASTSVGAFYWLRGATTVEQLTPDSGEFRAVINPRLITRGLDPAKQVAVADSLGMSNLDLLQEFSVTFRLTDGLPLSVEARIVWPEGSRADGVNAQEISVSLAYTEQRDIRLDTPTLSIPAEEYLFLLSAAIEDNE